MASPATLPADFFDKHQTPDTLPAGFDFDNPAGDTVRVQTGDGRLGSLPRANLAAARKADPKLGLAPTSDQPNPVEVLTADPRVQPTRVPNRSNRPDLSAEEQRLRVNRGPAFESDPLTGLGFVPEDPLQAHPAHPESLPSQQQFDQSHQAALDQLNRSLDGPALRPGPEPSFFEKIKRAVLGNPQGAPGQTDTPIGRAVGISYEAPSDPHANTADLPLARVSALAPQNPTSVAGGAGKGAAQFAEGMTTAPNLLMAAGSGGVGVLGKMAPFLPRAVSAVFSVDMLKNAYDQYPDVKAAIDKQDWPRAAQAITEAGLTAGMGLLAGAHAVRGEGAPRVTPEQAAESARAGVGEMTYDNLFWDRTFKDALHLMVRSVGWNLGDLREMSTAAGALKRIATGKGKEADPHGLGFVLGYAFTGAMIGALTQYLHTGHGPQELEDYFWPKREDGKRYVAAPYIKDTYQFARDLPGTLIHKTGPLVNTLAEMVTNKDYYDRPIRNLDDSAIQQLQQEAGFVLRQLLPFTLQEAAGPQSKKVRQEAADEAAHPEHKVEHFLGVQTAPAQLQPGYKSRSDQRLSR